MANYVANNAQGGSAQNLAATYKTIVALTAATATLTSAKIYDVLIGTLGTPADNVVQWDISAQTAAGTSTAVTPTQLDPTNRAAGTVASVNFTAEGTITAASSVFNIGINQRASYRWVAAPGGEIIIPKTNLAGFALRALSPAYTSTVSGQMNFSE